MKTTTPALASEDDFLALIAASFPAGHPSLILGRGDDCAEIACPAQMAVSTDLFVEDTHFRLRYFTPEEIGHKAIAVNLSDMAAAGARPLGLSVGLTTPVPFLRETATGLVKGMASIAEKYNVALTGGDLSQGPNLALCVTVWGAPGGTAPDSTQANEKTQAASFLRRGPVRAGDALFVCGRLGLARAGLLMLEETGRAAVKTNPAACAAHLAPTPLVDAGLALARLLPGTVCRLMDVSDGLARDLPRMLCAYGQKAGAEIILDENDVEFLHPEVTAYARSRGISPAAFAFRGGEDYALLGSCAADAFPLVREALEGCEYPLRRIGTVTGKPGITLNSAPVRDAGFDHFCGHTP